MKEDEAAVIQDLVEEVDMLLSEDKMAEAAVLLFDINKNQRDIWLNLKIALFRSAFNHRELFLLASIVGVAEKEFLSQSFHLVPGLFALRKTHEIR